MTPAEVRLLQESSWQTVDGYSDTFFDHVDTARTAHISARYVAARQLAAVCGIF
jgi:hypothetical protein